MPVDEYRLTSLENRMGKLEDRTENVAVMRNQIAGLKEELHELGQEVGSLRKALYTAALSVAGGAIIFALTLLQVLQ
jgi:archaellum component FlaC